MSIIRFNPNELDAVAEFLDSIPEVEDMDAETMADYRVKIEDAIRRLDENEPKNETSDAFAMWAEMHEDLEDILDEILDAEE